MAQHPSRTHPAAVEELGTILSVWAHPDDETYLAGGLMAAARDAGQRVLCVSATAGELGTSDPDRWPPTRLGRRRRWEAAAAMAVLGVVEHRIMNWPDGDLDLHHEEGVLWVSELLDEIRPDTVVTFGPDGITHHSDHIAVHRWVTDAWRQRGGHERLLYAVSTREHLDRFAELYEDTGTFMTEQRPSGTPEADLDLHVKVGGPQLDRKLVALHAMASQTEELIKHLGPDAYADMVADETFVAASSGRVLSPPVRHLDPSTSA